MKLSKIWISLLILVLAINAFIYRAEAASDEALLQIYEELRKINLKATNSAEWGHSSNMTLIDGGDIYVKTVTADKIAAGQISSESIELVVSAGTGDVEIRSGISTGDFNNSDVNSGFILGIDDSDSDTAKFYIGDGTSYLEWDGTTFTINSPVITNIAIGSEVGIQGWQHDMVFSVTDADTVAWATGTITLLNGVTYSITGANTGDMTALTYIYLDIGASTTVLQTTTTASTAAGSGKIIIAVAENSTNEATFQVFGGMGGIKVTGGDIENLTITASQIAANTITANEIAANTITSNEIVSGTITADLIGAGNFEIIMGLDSQAKIRSTESYQTYPYIQLGQDGLELKTSDSGGTYGIAVYGTDKYGYGSLGWIFNSTLKIPIAIVKEPNAGAADVADMRFYNRTDDPGGTAEVGDICVVNAVLKLCTSAGTPGTWQATGGL